MSLIKTALVTALLASSSVAFADTGVSFSASAQYSFGTSTAPVVRDHRTNQAPYAMPPSRAMSWSVLSAQLQLQTGMDVIRLQGRQSLSQIRLQATSGKMQIDRVTVRFLDGTTQTIRVKNVISLQNPMMELNLQANSTGVESISILGHGGRRASYQVLALANRYEQLPSRPVVNFSGTYSSVYGDVSITQTGNHIHGEYSNKVGVFDGYVINSMALVDWIEPGRTGRASFWFGADGKIEGTWGNNTSTTDGAEWDLVRR